MLTPTNSDYRASNDMEALTQAIFKDAPDWVESAAINKDGDVCWYPVRKEFLKVSIVGHHPPADLLPRWKLIGRKYDATDWQNSAIDRMGYKCISCGYFHAPHQCRECECINCYSSIV